MAVKSCLHFFAQRSTFWRFLLPGSNHPNHQINWRSDHILFQQGFVNGLQYLSFSLSRLIRVSYQHSIFQNSSCFSLVNHSLEVHTALTRNLCVFTLTKPSIDYWIFGKCGNVDASEKWRWSRQIFSFIYSSINSSKSPKSFWNCLEPSGHYVIFEMSQRSTRELRCRPFVRKSGLSS